jgi:HK97 family phage major capsid protein
MIMSENAFKALSKTDTELRIANYIVLFNSRDLEFVKRGKNADGSMGEYFTPAVDVDSPATKAGRFSVNFEHGEDPTVKGDVLGYVDWPTAKRDEKGIFVERVLDRRKKYVLFLENLIEAGLIGNSSEADPIQVKTLADGAIVRWPLLRDTLTVSPTEPRMLSENTLQALKSLSSVSPAAKALLDTYHSPEKLGLTNPTGQSDIPGGGAEATAGHRTQAGAHIQPRSKAMDILEAIKKLIPGLTPEQYDQIATILGLTGVQIAASPDPNAVDAAGKPMKSITTVELVTALKALGYPVTLPGQQPARKPAVVRPPYNFTPADADPDPEDAATTARAKGIDAAYQMRYKDESEGQKAILSDLIGPNYRQVIHEQNVAFAAYLRRGESTMDPAGLKSLRRMYFPIDRVVALIQDGFDVATIKAVQVEAMGELGGYAVPPNVQSEIGRRLPGLTAVRGGGARVVQLVNSNSIEIPQYSGNSDRWIGLMRGQWGNETKMPEDQNFKMNMVSVIAQVYTYKVPMSQSLVEDAANLVSLVQEDISITSAMDEDDVELTGDGIGKPLGILPGGSNTLLLKEVLSEDSATLTASGIKALKRGIPSQYRGKGVWVANSDTYGVIEKLTYTVNGEYVFEDLSETDMLLNRKTFESGAMPDVATNAYPLLYSDMSGYTIVERLGMSIQRFQDSYTGPNKVEFHVRRRIGGRVEKPWLFAVQKVDEESSI